MKKISNKFSLLVAFCLLVGVITTGCKNGNEPKEETIFQDGKGHIVGYIKSLTLIDDNGKLYWFFGLLIITDTQDSLLSYNIEPTSIGLAPVGNWFSGVYSFDNYGFDGAIKINFKYRNAVKNEIVNDNFVFPTNAILYDMSNFKQQIIITNIERDEG